ncbi:MAG: hypothetical protein ACR2F6_13435 [Mycobacteriales bacterium]
MLAHGRDFADPERPRARRQQAMASYRSEHYPPVVSDKPPDGAAESSR